MHSRPCPAFVSVLCLAAGCASGARAVEAPLGVYPRTNPVEASPPRLDPGWQPAGAYSVRLRVDVPVAAVLVGLPHTGSSVPVRPTSWPAPVRLNSVGDAGAVLAGPPVSATRISEDVRCPAAATPRPVGVTADVSQEGSGMSVEVRYELSGPGACEVSASGRRRLQALAADLFLWVRGVGSTGARLPIRP